MDETPRWKVGEFSLLNGEDCPFPDAPQDRWSPEDDVDPRYCPRCRRKIPASMAARQGVCRECLERARGELPVTAGVDTHIGACPECGSRYVVSDDWGSPVAEGLKQGLLGSVYRMLGPVAAALSALVLRPNPVDEPDIWLRCQECQHRWRPEPAAPTRSESMREWDDVSRRMGPAEPGSSSQTPQDETGPQGWAEGPTEQSQGPQAQDQSQWRASQGPEGAAAEPEREGAVEWEDEFEPRFCVRCRRRISVLVSERQDVCDECLQQLETLARGALPNAMPPGPGELPPCPHCGSPDVERVWQTDWISRAVDIAMDVTSFFVMHDRYGNPLDSNLELGPAKVMRYHCRVCGEQWKPALR